MLGEQADHGEILKVLVVSNNVDWNFRTFEIMPPSGKCLKYSKEFLIVSVIIQFGDTQGAGMKSNRVDVTIGSDHRGNCSDSIVRGIHFDYKQSSRDKMQEDQR